MNIKDLKTKLIFCVFCGLFAISSVGGCSVNQKDTENGAVISAGVDQREDNLKQFDKVVKQVDLCNWQWGLQY